VLGGGGLFHDYYGVDEATSLTEWHWGLTFCDAFPVMAARFERPLLIHAAGVGPLMSAAGRRHTRIAFNRADIATVRDTASLDELRNAGVDVSRIRVAADPAFALPPASPASSSSAHGAGSSHPVLAVALRPWSHDVDQAAWMRIGTANETPVSVRALADIMAGHLRHHLGILRERYGVSAPG